jgi:tripeptide aminopeptidase
MSKKYPKAKIEVEIKEQYENMKMYVDKDPRPVKKAEEAIKKMGLTPVFSRIKGGTDGATFSKMGLVTPNLGTGSGNHHGRYEYLAIQDFEKMIAIVLEIVKI